jgi:sialic acid synthase SpsE
MAKCPGNGMPPYLADLFTGAKLVKDVKAEEDLVWEDVGKSVDDDWDAGE